jgi:capsid protein
MKVEDLTTEIIFTGLPWLDPLKEVKANREAVAADFTSEERVCREHGVELEEILREKARAKMLRERYGLTQEDLTADIEGDKEAAITTGEVA